MTTVHCACGSPFLAVLETRHFARKHLNIKGRYTVMSDSGLGGLVTLRDISEGGVGFTLAAPCNLLNPSVLFYYLNSLRSVFENYASCR